MQAFVWIEWAGKIYPASGMIFRRFRCEASHKSRCNCAFEKKSGDREKA